ncbi:MAG: hypothetical protein JWN48_415 [Myxococcaceae bacterium]|nr:hypothetical protein [Myxococcaceae bacterium]
MSGRQKQDDEELELTAQPKSVEDELAVSEEHEPGLSVDPDDLGRNFLSQALEQHNFESEIRGDGADPSDAALPGPNFESDHDVWENTVSLTMQGAGDDEPLIEDSDDALDAEEDQTDGLDLTENSIYSGSLLDSETDELGVTRAPELRTDDSHTHGKPRGGHAKPRAGGPSKGSDEGVASSRSSSKPTTVRPASKATSKSSAGKSTSAKGSATKAAGSKAGASKKAASTPQRTR